MKHEKAFVVQFLVALFCTFSKASISPLLYGAQKRLTVIKVKPNHAYNIGAVAAKLVYRPLCENSRWAPIHGNKFLCDGC